MVRFRLRIVLYAVIAAVVYGVVHNQFTARLCLEYFTIGHPPVFPTTDPTLLGLGWGVIATWWVGAILGVALAIAAGVGGRPERRPESLLRPLALLMAIAGLCAALAALVGWQLAESGAIWLVEPLASQVPPEKQSRFLSAGAAHLASYAVGFVGGAVLIWRVWRSRGRVGESG